MLEFQDYRIALMGIAVMLATVLVQSIIAAGSKAKQPDAVPGMAPTDAQHSNFVFRAYRTHMNSLENIALMIGTSFLAVVAGANPLWTGIWVWVFSLARIAHMVLYYAIATDKNPSPRSWFFLIGLAANIGLLVLAIITLL